jgi:hypothetical protein
MKWVEALKVWNAAKGGSWCVPRKGSEDHAAVMKIMGGAKKIEAPAAATPAAAPRMNKAQLMARARETKERKAMAMEDRDAPAPRPRRTKEELMAAIKALKERGMTKEKKAALLAQLRRTFERARGLMARETMQMEDRDAPGPMRDEVMDIVMPEPKKLTKAELMAMARARKAAKAAPAPAPAKSEMAFKFGLEPTMEQETGLIGFMDVIVNKIRPASFENVAKSNLMALARRVLFSLFPGASQIDSLVMSAFVNPLQTDGGIEVKQKGKKLVGSLIYEDRDDYDTAALRNATKKVLEDVKVVR